MLQNELVGIPLHGELGCYPFLSIHTLHGELGCYPFLSIHKKITDSTPLEEPTSGWVYDVHVGE
jgi:hypothetical protein